MIRPWLLLLALAAGPAIADPLPPSLLFGPLFDRVQMDGLFEDQKTFADMTPRAPAPEIMRHYRAETPTDDDQLRAFVSRWFEVPPPPVQTLPAATPSLRAHIAALWPLLTRPGTTPLPGDSLLPLAHPFVVPGGRFREVYYWDTYFTLLGLVADGRASLVGDTVADFTDMVAAYGHVPNGARTYYLSRSQPPVLYLMAGLTNGDKALAYGNHLAALRAEYAFWMDGADALAPGAATRRVVKLPDGTVLNRYWDARDAPRDESYREDVLAARARPDPAAAGAMYRDIRAAAESGWDFSSRWFADGMTLASIDTTDIVPVDLNSLLYGLEQAIALGCGQTGDEACRSEFQGRAERRRAAIDTYLWDGDHYADYDIRAHAVTSRASAAGLFPLFVGAAAPEKAESEAAFAERTLLAPGGLLTTPVRTGQQWDAPNGWAPLQWVAVVGLDAYGRHDLAHEIAKRWLGTVTREFRIGNRLVEKYDVVTVRPGGGGEYPNQDGFGWTNGVTRALMDRYPDLAGGD